MGLSSFSRYMNAWLDADVDEKKRILELMKSATGITATATATQGARQDIGIRGAAEERAQALFPSTLGKQESELSSLQRREANAVESETRQREILGELTETLKGLVAGQQYLQAGQVIDVMNKLGFAGAEGQAQVSQATQRGAEAQLGTERAGELLRAQEPEVAAQTAIDVSRGAGAEGQLRAETAGEQLRVGQPAAGAQAGLSETGARDVTAQVAQRTGQARLDQGVPEEAALAERLTAKAGALKAALNIELDSRRLSGEYIDIVTEAEQNVAGLKDDALWAQIKLMEAQAQKAVAPGADSRAPSRLEYLRSFLGDKEFAQMLIKKEMVETGYFDTAPKYMGKIQSAITDMTQITAAMQTDEGIDQVLAQIFARNPDFKVMLGTSGAQDKTDPNVVLRELARYIGVQKALLKERWGVDYKAITQLGQATHTYAPDDIGQLVRFVEESRGAPGALGEMVAKYQPLQNRADVIQALTNIMNRPDLHPMFWEDVLEKFGQPDPANPDKVTLRQHWGEQDFASARAIIRAAQYRLIQGLSANFDVTRPPAQPQTPAGVTQ